MFNGSRKSKVPKKSTWAEKGTTYFAYFIVIPTSVGLLASLIFLGFVVVVAFKQTIDGRDWALAGWSILVMMVMLGFAAALIHGMSKKNPNFVMAYIIFGVIKIIILVSLVIASNLMSLDDDENSGLHYYVLLCMLWLCYPLTYVIIGVCVADTLLLCMMHRAWSTMKARQMQDLGRLVHCDEGDGLRPGDIVLYCV